MVLDIEIPSLDEMENMTLDDLKEWRRKISPYYSKRFEMNTDDYKKVLQYIAFSMMIENIENDIDKWTRISSKRKKLKEICSNEPVELNQK